jgi:beta-lactamase superfamily II metal-dependent hydrolase
MDISIDMLAVGNADALIVHLKDSTDTLAAVIDGGNPGDGQKIIDHLEAYVLPYSTRSGPDLVISTHPDGDHVGGLSEVVEHYKSSIWQVWVHDPSQHVSYEYFPTLAKTVRSRHLDAGRQRLLKSINQLTEFVSLVDSYSISRIEPFYGLNVGPIQVLGPSVEFYESLLPGYAELSEFASKEAVVEELLALEEYRMDLSDTLRKLKESDFACPTVDENNESSAKNESSVVVQITVGVSKYLFTGDAGVAAFQDIQTRTPLEDIFWLDVPHHGSRRNLTSDLISTLNPNIACVSAKGDKKHPRRALVNCFKRKGLSIYSTHKSGNLWQYTENIPGRIGYSTAEPL